MPMCTLSCFSCVRLFATLWIVAQQAPLCMGFSRQEYWSGSPGLTLEDFHDPGIKPTSLVTPALQADSLPLSHQGSSSCPYTITYLTFLLLMELGDIFLPVFKKMFFNVVKIKCQTQCCFCLLPTLY